MPSDRVAVVSPAYNEESVLPEYFRQLAQVFDANPHVEWLSIVINDGSRDRTAELLAEQALRDARFRVLNLSRNFGFQAALAAGLMHAEELGVDAVVTMDADLQDPPTLLPELVQAWKNGASVVRAVRRSRQETGFRRLGMDLFHRLFHRLADFPIESNTGTFCLLDRHAVKALNQMPERHRFFPGLRAWVGFAHADVFYDRQERAAGQPQQTLKRLMRYAFDGVFSFSRLPLRALTYAGVFVGFCGFALGLYYVVRRLVDIETAPTGFTTLAALVLFLGGVQLIGIGVLGEYLGRIYDEVKRRPLYVLKTRDRRAPPPRSDDL